MRQYQAWSIADKQKLHDLVKQQGARHIQWNDIAKQMNKTQQQCKSFYQNVLKKEFNISKSTYKKWDITKKIILVYASHLYDNNWDPIQEQYFPNSSVQQLKNICSSTKGWYNKTVDNILYNYQNQDSLKNLTIQKLEMQLIILRIIDYRMHIDSPTPQQIPEEAKPYAIFQLPTKHLFELQLHWRWHNVDTKQLIKTYEQVIQQKMVTMLQLKVKQMQRY